ncbi:MAG: hypothetical protein GY931_15365 [Maribacter sp.]|nr:hypothetical protein [Maribacter sp.]
MKKSIKIVVFGAVLVLFTVFACSKDDSEPLVKEGGPFAISELAGNWEASSANFNGGNVNIDVVDQGGTVSLTVQGNGNFTLNIDPVDRAAYTVSGEMFWEKFEGEFYFAIEWDDYPGDWDTYGATLAGTTFSINGGADTGEYDFNDDGTFESASISFTFIRA